MVSSQDQSEVPYIFTFLPTDCIFSQNVFTWSPADLQSQVQLLLLHICMTYVFAVLIYCKPDHHGPMLAYQIVQLAVGGMNNDVKRSSMRFIAMCLVATIWAWQINSLADACMHTYNPLYHRHSRYIHVCVEGRLTTDRGKSTAWSLTEAWERLACYRWPCHFWCSSLAATTLWKLATGKLVASLVRS